MKRANGKSNLSIIKDYVEGNRKIIEKTGESFTGTTFFSENNIIYQVVYTML